MSKHTPGPWYPGHFTDATHSCECRYVLTDEYMGAICTVHFDNGIKYVADGAHDCPPRAEAEANAFLIAASPERLKELKNVTKRFHRCMMHSGSDKEFADLAVASARAAIAKAETGT